MSISIQKKEKKKFTKPYTYDMLPFLCKYISITFTKNDGLFNKI